MPHNITEASLKLFLAYAKDAGNWSGSPLVGGNVGGSKEDRGNLTQLKKAGLITTFVDEGLTWIIFTKDGRFLAHRYGIMIGFYDQLKREGAVDDAEEVANDFAQAEAGFHLCNSRSVETK